jgi:hypothetical protein
MSVSKSEQISEATRDILTKMQQDPSNCETFLILQKDIAMLMMVGHKDPERSWALLMNVAAIHRESGCDFSINHPGFDEINAPEIE